MGRSARPRWHGRESSSLPAAPFAGVFRRFIPAARLDDGIRRGDVQLLGAGAAAAGFRSAVGGHRRAGDCRGRVLGGCPSRAGEFRRSWSRGWFRWRSGSAIGYVHPVWQGISFNLPFRREAESSHAMALACRIMSVIAPMAIYHILQDIASVEGAAPRGTITTCAVWSPGTASARCRAAWREHRHAGDLRAASAIQGDGCANRLRVVDAADFPAPSIMSGLTHSCRAVFSVADSGGDDRLRSGRSRQRDAARASIGNT